MEKDRAYNLVVDMKYNIPPELEEVEAALTYQLPTLLMRYFDDLETQAAKQFIKVIAEPICFLANYRLNKYRAEKTLKLAGQVRRRDSESHDPELEKIKKEIIEEVNRRVYYQFTEILAALARSALRRGRE